MERTVGAALRGRPRFKIVFAKLKVVLLRTCIQTEGGHGGPPLQYVFW